MARNASLDSFSFPAARPFGVSGFVGPRAPLCGFPSLLECAMGDYRRICHSCVDHSAERGLVLGFVRPLVVAGETASRRDETQVRAELAKPVYVRRQARWTQCTGPNLSQESGSASTTPWRTPTHRGRRGSWFAANSSEA